MAHGFDGLVMIPNCDKNVPGLLMAAARLNIPTIFVSGGPMLAGRLEMFPMLVLLSPTTWKDTPAILKRRAVLFKRKITGRSA